MRKYLVIFVVVFVLGCSSPVAQTTDVPDARPWEPEGLRVIETQRFISFCYKTGDCGSAARRIEVVQLAAEAWMQAHPEYEILDVSTSQSSYVTFSFSMTLRVEKKK